MRDFTPMQKLLMAATLLMAITAATVMAVSVAPDSLPSKAHASGILQPF